MNLAKFIAALSRTGYSLSALAALVHIRDMNGDANMTSIAKAVGHSTAAATGIVDMLAKKGLAERQHAPEDRRKVFVLLTMKGDRLCQDIDKEAAKLIAEAIKEMKAKV